MHLQTCVLRMFNSMTVGLKHKRGMILCMPRYTQDYFLGAVEKFRLAWHYAVVHDALGCKK